VGPQFTFLACPTIKQVQVIIFSTNATSQLGSLPIVNLRPIECNEFEALGGETPSVSPHDPGN
jgi:hypothetical protein